MHALFGLAQSPPGAGMPSWLTSGSLPIILVIIVGLIIIYIWINFRMKRIQRDLHDLGHSYYEREKVILDDLKAGRLTRGEYDREHKKLVSEMRRDSRRRTDGPPR